MELQRRVRSSTSTQRDALRARIVLLRAEGRSEADVAATTDVSVNTVSLWSRRFELGGLDMFDESYDYPINGELASGKAPRVVIESFRGSARVTGSSDSSVKVTGHKTIRSIDQQGAERADRETAFQITGDSGNVVIQTNQNRASGLRRVTEDMEIAVPKGASIEAHGRDEAGWEEEAGHRDMWFAARDIAFERPVDELDIEAMLLRMGFGPNRPGADGRRLLPDDVAPDLELMVSLMVRVLFIEISAFHTFAWAEEWMSDTDLVGGDGEAARLVSYIRADE